MIDGRQLKLYMLDTWKNNNYNFLLSNYSVMLRQRILLNYEAFTLKLDKNYGFIHR
jgi:hypothetical protein